MGLLRGRGKGGAATWGFLWGLGHERYRGESERGSGYLGMVTGYLDGILFRYCIYVDSMHQKESDLGI